MTFVGLLSGLVMLKAAFAPPKPVAVPQPQPANTLSKTKHSSVAEALMLTSLAGGATRKIWTETLSQVSVEAFALSQSLQQGPVANHSTPPEERICSINAVDTELSVILNELTDATGANLIVIGSEKKTITLRMSNVRLGEMLRHICAVSGLRYLKVDSAFVIASEGELRKAYPAEWAALNPEPPPPPPPPGIVTRIYQANHTSAAQIVSAIKELFGSDSLRVSVGPASVVPSVTSQETSYATGIKSGAMEGGDAKAREGRTLVIQGPEDLVEAAIKIAQELDRPRRQVSIAVTIHDISNEALKELGLSWSFSDLIINQNDPTGIGSWSHAPMTFTAKIKALEKVDKAKLLAAPNITVLDGERGFILIGTRLNFPVLVGYTQSNSPIYDRQEERVGIYLQVAATVSDADEITLSLYPQVSTVTGFLEVNGASYPQISTREAQTSIRVKNGEMIVMGGMLKDEEIAQIEKVPLLSEIPVLGELFKRRKRTKVSSQVIISIRPTIFQPVKDESR